MLICPEKRHFENERKLNSKANYLKIFFLALNKNCDVFDTDNCMVR